MSFSDLADPKKDTHLLDLLEQILKIQGITLIRSGYTADGIMADVRHSVNSKDYIITITEKR